MAMLGSGILLIIAGAWLCFGTGSIVGPVYLVGVAFILTVVDLVQHLRR